LILDSDVKEKVAYTPLPDDGEAMQRGLALVNIYADDLDAARRWYAELIGIDAYLDRPGYTEFRIGDYQHELGIIDRRYAPQGDAKAPGGAIGYWHVDAIEVAFERPRSACGSTNRSLPGGEAGFVTASVIDPFGNVLAIMYIPHYLDMLGRVQRG
jgi:predicted enzyme related to lactoylglutathione lyase